LDLFAVNKNKFPDRSIYRPYGTLIFLRLDYCYKYVVPHGTNILSFCDILFLISMYNNNINFHQQCAKMMYIIYQEEIIYTYPFLFMNLVFGARLCRNLIMGGHGARPYIS
jgi:hypothetical protein